MNIVGIEKIVSFHYDHDHKPLRPQKQKNFKSCSFCGATCNLQQDSPSTTSGNHPNIGTLLHDLRGFLVYAHSDTMLVGDQRHG